MTDPLFPIPDTPLVPLADERAAYPVRRIFCVGRNYAAHAAEMGNEVDRAAPFYSPSRRRPSARAVPRSPILRARRTVITRWNWSWPSARRPSG